MQQTVSWLSRFSGLSQSLALVPPRSVEENLSRRFAAWSRSRHQPAPQPDVWQRLVATLGYDSRAQLARPGVRAGTAGSAPRQLVFNSAAADITLFVMPRANDLYLDVNGQIFPSDENQFSALTINLLHGNAQFGLTAANELHEFEFERVPPGTYAMTLHTEQCEILVSPIELSL